MGGMENPKWNNQWHPCLLGRETSVNVETELKSPGSRRSLSNRHLCRTPWLLAILLGSLSSTHWQFVGAMSQMTSYEKGMGEDPVNSSRPRRRLFRPSDEHVDFGLEHASTALDPVHLMGGRTSTVENHRGLQTEQQCTLAMAIRDSNRDDQLSQDEYVNFLNQLFANKYASTPFSSLPCEVQQIFDTYAVGGSIDVSGTKPGQTATAEQETRISELCSQVLTTVNSNPTSGPCEDDSSPVESPVEAPVAAPTGGGGGSVNCEGTIQRAQCNTALAIADLSRDNQMDESEFVRFVNRLSSNAYRDSTFSQLPGNVQATFSKFATNGAVDVTGSKPGQTATGAQDELLDALCCETDVAVSNPGSPVATPTLPPVDGGGGGGDDDDDDGAAGPDCTGTIPQTQCNTALAIADLSRDDLMNQVEYLRFVNRLSNNAYLTAQFATLPDSLQSNFQKFATTNGQVDVSGTKPGQSPTPVQAEFLASLCCETDLTIQNPDGGGSIPTTPTAPTAPSPSPPTAAPAPTFQGQLCRNAMASSDFNRDSQLNQVEYVRYLNRLTQNQFLNVAFEDLGATLQSNFQDNAQNGEISIFGTKPGESPTAAQAQFLDDFCLDTAVALQEGDSGTPPTDPPIESPDVDLGFCRTAMATSDASRDDYLNESEFVVFLNRLTSDQFAGLTFDELSSALRQTYQSLLDISTGEIWIFGATPGEDASDPQEDFLADACIQIFDAINRSDGTLAPAVPPSSVPPPTEGPTLPPGIAEVYNSFIISNTRATTASQLQDGPNRDGLNSAYSTFAQQVVDEMATARRTLQHLRSRRLAAAYADGTGEIYLILDRECPEGLEATETCQTVFAKFRLQIDDEDPNQISTEYSEATQQQISDGVLQDVLIEVDPRNSLRVVDASLPLISTLPPTPSPVATEAPVTAPRPSSGRGGGGSPRGRDNDDGGSSAGAIVGGIIGGILLCALIGWGSTKLKGRKVKGLDDDDEKADDASDAEKEDGLGGIGMDTEDDTAFGEKPVDTKKTFGFGKKNKEKEDDNAFGADDSADNAFGDDNSNNMELFAFDEPSVVKGNEDPDGASANGSNTFGASESGWGNTNKNGGFFGNDSGWGAPKDGGGESENFFGNSNFGDDAGSRSVSHSGSGGSGSRSGSDKDSYSSSEDDTYQSGSRSGSASVSASRTESSYVSNEGGEGDGSRSGSYSRSSAGEGSSYVSGSRDPDGDSYTNEGSSRDFSSRRSPSDRDRDDNSASENSASGDDGSYSGSGSRSGSESVSGSETSATTRTEDREKRDEYYAQVDALVRLVLPDEVEKVDAMMEQFKGREAELVSTLQTMQERSATQRARAAVHKSKLRPQRGEEGTFLLNSGGGGGGGAEGSAAGTAAIAAASLPIPADGMFEEESGDFEDGERVPEGEEGSYYSDEEGSQSYSGSGSRSGSYSGSGSRTGSYQSGEEGSSYRSGSYRSGDGSHSQSGSQSGSRSYYSQSQQSGSQSYFSGSQQEEGSYRSGSYTGSQGSHSGSGSYRSGSQRSGSASGSYSRSQMSGSQQEGSFQSGSYSGTGSQPESSYRSGSYTASQSQSNFSGSRPEGEESSYSGDEEGSYHSGEEGEESYYSGDQSEEASFQD